MSRQYPIYRKFINRNVFCKVLDDKRVVTVHTGGPEPDNDQASIVISNNSMQRSECVNAKYSQAATPDELPHHFQLHFMPLKYSGINTQYLKFEVGGIKRIGL